SSARRSHHPVGASPSGDVPPGWRGREARQRPAKPYTRVRIPSPPRAIGAAVARFPDTEEVTGSIPVSPTTITAPHLTVRGLRRVAGRFGRGWSRPRGPTRGRRRRLTPRSTGPGGRRPGRRP